MLALAGTSAVYLYDLDDNEAKAEVIDYPGDMSDIEVHVSLMPTGSDSASSLIV
jgi:hypothetical protein